MPSTSPVGRDVNLFRLIGWAGKPAEAAAAGGFSLVKYSSDNRNSARQLF